MNCKTEWSGAAEWRLSVDMDRTSAVHLPSDPLGYLGVTHVVWWGVTHVVWWGVTHVVLWGVTHVVWWLLPHIYRLKPVA